MPIPRGGGAQPRRRARAADPRPRRHVRDRRRRRARARRRAGARPACARRTARRVTAERAVIANVTPTQLYGRLLDGVDVPAAVREGASRFRYGRSEMQIHFALSEPAALAGRRAAERHRDRPRHAGARRRLARRQRGRARAAARRGDGRRRPAAHDRPLARARGQRAPLDPAAGAAVARQGRRRRRDRRRRRHLDGRRCASGTPTASRRGSRSTSRTSSRAS